MDVCCGIRDCTIPPLRLWIVSALNASTLGRIFSRQSRARHALCVQGRLSGSQGRSVAHSEGSPISCQVRQRSQSRFSELGSVAGSKGSSPAGTVGPRPHGRLDLTEDDGGVRRWRAVARRPLGMPVQRSSHRSAPVCDRTQAALGWRSWTVPVGVDPETSPACSPVAGGLGLEQARHFPQLGVLRVVA